MFLILRRARYFDPEFLWKAGLFKKRGAYYKLFSENVNDFFGFYFQITENPYLLTNQQLNSPFFAPANTAKKPAFDWSEARNYRQ